MYGHRSEKSKGEPVWASWDLTAGDVGGSGRNSTYYTDTTLPANFYHVTMTDYNGVGTNNFNRGHLCPSADRTDTTNNNKLVFYMSNIMPQSALNNQGVWRKPRRLLSRNPVAIPATRSITCVPVFSNFIPGQTRQLEKSFYKAMPCQCLAKASKFEDQQSNESSVQTRHW